MADTEGLCQFIKRDDGGVSFALLQPADVLLAEAGDLGKLLLRQAGLLPDPACISSDQLAHIHARMVSGSRALSLSTIICNPHCHRCAQTICREGQEIQGCDFDDVGRSSQAQHELSVTQAAHMCENLARVDFERLRYVEELNDVYATFTALILGHERLRAAKRFGNLGLGQALVLARPYQLFQQPALAGRSKRCRHQTVLKSIQIADRAALPAQPPAP